MNSKKSVQGDKFQDIWGITDTVGQNSKELNYWRIKIVESSPDQLYGKTLKDTLLQNGKNLDHKYTEEDIKRGVWMTINDEHKFKLNVEWVKNENKNVIGWTYTFPEEGGTIYCSHCGKSFTLEGLDALYKSNGTPNQGLEKGLRIYYTSTPQNAPSSGSVNYYNDAKLGDLQSSTYHEIRYSDKAGGDGKKDVDKDGCDINTDGYTDYKYTLTIDIPGYKSGHPAVNWNTKDKTFFEKGDKDKTDIVAHLENKLGDNDPNTVVKIANKACTAQKGNDGGWYYVNEDAGVALKIIREGDDKNPDQNAVHMYFYNKCKCADHVKEGEGYCKDWNNTDGCKMAQNNIGGILTGYCDCWYDPKDVKITIEYYAYGKDILNSLYPNGERIPEAAVLYNSLELRASTWRGDEHKFIQDQEDWSSERVPLKDVFTKDIENVANAQNGYVASYVITVNEGKYPLEDLLQGDKDVIRITDKMSEYLFYQAGTLQVLEDGVEVPAERLNLIPDEQGHGFTLEIREAQGGTFRHVYTLKYNAQLISLHDGNPTYTNRAQVNLFAQGLEVDTDKRGVDSYNASASTYKVTLQKFDEEGNELADAKFQLVDRNGSPIGGRESTQSTGSDGTVSFSTTVSAGIIFAQHVPYFFKEVEAPAGYELSDTEYGFFFCDATGECSSCGDLIEQGFTRISQYDEEVDILAYNYPNPAELTIPVKKIIQGTDKTDEEFTFLLELTKPEGSDGVTMPSPAELTIKGEGEGSFGNIKFTKTGTYTFQITEQAKEGSDFQQDETVWYVEVKVEKEEGKGLQATITSRYYMKGGERVKADEITFTNTYIQKTTSVSVKKEWVIGTKYGTEITKPDISVQLKQNGTDYTGGSVTLNDSNGWTHTWNDLPLTDGEGKNYEYSVDEVDVPAGFTKTVDPEGTSYSYTITNTYAPQAGEFQPHVTKTVSGNGAVQHGLSGEKDFQFVLTQTAPADKPLVAGGAMLTDTATVHVTPAADGTYTAKETKLFGQLSFAEPGTYEFTITETGPESPWTNKTGVYNVKVEVGPQADTSGKLVVKATYFIDGKEQTVNDDTVTFENAYDAKTSVSVEKVWMKDGTKTAAPVDSITVQLLQDGVVTGEPATLNSSNSWSTSWDDLPKYMDEAGKEHQYSVQEVEVPEGWTADVSSAVSDGKGNWTITITNTYKPESTSATPVVRKIVSTESATIPEPGTEFTFTMKADGTNPEGGANPTTFEDQKLTVTEAARTDAPSVDFGSITFSKAGTYTYTIKEVETDANGWTCDKGTWTWTVIVEDKDGELVVLDYNYAYHPANPEEKDKHSYTHSLSDAAGFVNEYTPSETKFTPWVGKTVKTAGGVDATEETFEFSITAAADYSGAVVMGSDTVSVTTANSGKAAFGSITFKKAGTYRFTISETAGTNLSYTYDGDSVTLEVEVEDVGGQLQVKSATYAKTNGTTTGSAVNEDGTLKMTEGEADVVAPFVNPYTHPATAIPEITKLVQADYGEPKAADGVTTKYPTFEFNLKLMKYQETASSKEITDDALANITGYVSAMSDSKTLEDYPTHKTVTFEGITFYKEGTYTFEIHEKTGTDAGWKYDENVVTWTVTVTRDADGLSLRTNEVYSQKKDETPVAGDGQTFTNIYEPAPATAQIPVTKTIPMDEGTYPDTEFSFTLTPASGNPEGGWSFTSQTVTLSLPGESKTWTTNFGDIKFTKAGTYSFVVKETKGEAEGWTYDAGEWHVTIIVTDQNGTLKVTDQSYEYWLNGEKVEPAGRGSDVFVNTYELPLTAFTATKVWVDQNGTLDTRPAQIEVRLYADDVEMDEPYSPVTLSKGVDGNWGNIEWEKLPKYKIEGGKAVEITYTVKEDPVPGYDSDVIGPDKDGNFTITNTLMTQEASAVLQAHKTVTMPALEDTIPETETNREFTFTLQGDGVKQTGSAKNGETFEFSGITYTEKDIGKTYTYTITETPADGYDCDTSVWTVEVEISLNKETGELEANATYYKGTAEAKGTEPTTGPAEFTNVYLPKINIPVEKVWVLPEGTTDEEAKALKSKITVHLTADDGSGERTETLNADNKWSHVWENLPKYKKNADGKYEEIKYSVSEAPVPGFIGSSAEKGENGTYTITNTFNPDSASVKIPVKKVVAVPAPGETPMEEDFVFELYDAEKKLLGKVTVPGDGSATFEDLSALEFDKPGTYEFTVKELTGDGNYKYDDTVYDVTVTVTFDKGTGTLTATPSYRVQGAAGKADEIVFTNTYLPKTSITVDKEWVYGEITDERILGMLEKLSGSITIRLTGNGGTTTNREYTFPAKELTGTWSYTFDNLDKYVEDSNSPNGYSEIKYSVEEVSGPKGYTPSVAGYKITNTYTPTPIKIMPKAQKNVTGMEIPDPNTEEFTFTLTGEGMSRSETITGAGEVVFDEIEYTKPGIYEYTITETAGTNPEYTYDTTVWYMEVAVTPNDDGTLGTVVTYYYKDAEGNPVYPEKENDYPTFTNIYLPKTVRRVEKIWTGDEGLNVRPSSITVELLAGGKSIGKTATLGPDNWKAEWTNLDKYVADSNAEDGYREIEYTVREKEVPGYTHGDPVYEEGTYTYTITNKYNPTAVTYTPKAEKSIKGEDAPDGTMFYFTLEDSTGSVRQTSSRAGVGSVSFNEITYERPGTYTYTITEDQSNPAPNYKYDGAKWTLTVEVEMDGEGNLHVTSSTYTREDGQKSNEAASFTNVYTAKTQIRVQKIWEDADDQDGKRPESIPVQLQRNGEKYGDSVTLDERNNWTYTWTNLDKYPMDADDTQGEAYNYTVEEVLGELAGVYSASQRNIKYAVDGEKYDWVQITNTHEPEQTEVSVEKVWDDKNDQDGLRTWYVEVQLKADGEDVDGPVRLEASNHWSYKWTDLPKYKAGKEIVYEVEEVELKELADYEVSYKSAPEGTGVHFTVTNTHETEKTKISVKKVWEDEDDQDNKRPDSILVRLKANGDPKGTPVELKEDNGWSHEWTDLPVYEDGRKIYYSVQELNVPEGYTVSYSSEEKDTDEGTDVHFTVTNTHTPETVQVSVEKKWELNGANEFVKTPESIQVQLKANGVAVDESVTLDESNEWKHSWPELPKYKNGDPKAITYSVEEVDVPAGYVPEYSEFSYGSETLHVTYTIENVFNPGFVSFAPEVEKKIDGDPAAPDDTETFTFNIALKEGNASGIRWALDGQTTTVQGANKASFKNITFVKPGVYVFQITEQAGKNLNYSYDTTTWYVTVTVTDKTGGGEAGDEPDGKLEIESAVYATEGVDPEPGATKGPAVFTNKYTKPGELVVSKRVTGAGNTAKDWHFTVTLEGEKAGEVNGIYGEMNFANGVAEFTLKHGESRKATNLPAGLEYTVTEAEANADGYRTTYEPGNTGTIQSGEEASVEANNFRSFPQLTPTPTPEQTPTPTPEQSETPTPEQSETPTPEQSETPTPEQSETPTPEQSETPTPEQSETPTPEQSETPTPEQSETPTPEQSETPTPEQSETPTPEESEAPAPVDITVRKVWDDGENIDEMRPTSVTVQLLADGAVLETVTLDETNGWQYSWTGLEASQNGRMITYSVSETSVPEGYTATVTQEGTTYTITNSHTPMPRFTDVAGTKVWIDQNNVRGLRPAAIEVRLYRNGTLIASETPEWTRTGNVWTFRFANLPYADENHVPYEYTVRETPVANYTTEQTGTTITNTIIPQTIDIAGTKTWQDNNNADGIRPTSITVRLLRDGEIYREQTVTAADGWRYSFTDLPDSDPATGRMYNYTISERMVTGYYARVEGYNLINVELPRNPDVPDNPPPVPVPPGDEPPVVPIDEYEPPLGITELGEPTEEELEDLVEIFDYDTPLWGELLATGDDIPAYPFVFGGIGMMALLALVIEELSRKKRKKEQ